MKQKDVDKPNIHWTKTMQFTEKYGRLKPEFLKMMQKYVFVWEEHLEKNTVANRRIV